MSSLVPVQRLCLRDSVLQVEQPIMTQPKDAAVLFRTVMRNLDREEVYAMTLDINDRMIGITRLGVGTVDHVDLPLREIFKYVLARDNATGFIIAHNHTSGNALPSLADIAHMRNIRDEGRRLNCELKDFIVIGDGTGEYYSRRDQAYDL